MSADLTEKLLAMAEAEAKSPEGRHRLLVDLCLTVRALQAGCICDACRGAAHPVLSTPAEAAGMRAAAAAISEHLALASEHMEFLADIMTRPLQAG